MTDETPSSENESTPPDPKAAADPTGGVGEMADQALDRAQQSIDDLRQQAGGESDPAGGKGDAESGDEDGGEATGPNVNLPPFQQVLADVEARGIDLLHDVDLNVKIELGRTHMLVEDVLKLAEGNVVELDKLAGDPVDVYVNDRLVARGEVLVLNDNFCVRISEIIANVSDLKKNGQDGDNREGGEGSEAQAAADTADKR